MELELNISPGQQVPTIINLLSEQIGQRMRGVANERAFPSRDADTSDDYIKEGTETIRTLRRIRQELESVFYGDIGG